MQARKPIAFGGMALFLELCNSLAHHFSVGDSNDRGIARGDWIALAVSTVITVWLAVVLAKKTDVGAVTLVAMVWVISAFSSVLSAGLERAAEFVLIGIVGYGVLLSLVALCAYGVTKALIRLSSDLRESKGRDAI